MGRESTTIADIKAYQPKNHSLTSGQVLACDYNYEECRLIVKEMADLLCLDLVEKNLVTESISLYLGHSDEFGREPARGTISMATPSSSPRVILPYVEQLYEKIAKPSQLVKRVNLSFNHVMDEAYQQYDLFVDNKESEKERQLQMAVLELKKKFGKNAVLKGMNLEKAGTTIERNLQIGGHKSGES